MAAQRRSERTTTSQTQSIKDAKEERKCDNKSDSINQGGKEKAWRKTPANMRIAK